MPHHFFLSVCTFALPADGGSTSGAQVNASPLAPLTTWSGMFRLNEQTNTLSVQANNTVPVLCVFNVLDTDASAPNGQRDGQTMALSVFEVKNGVTTLVGSSGSTVFNEISATELMWRNTSGLASQVPVELRPGYAYVLTVYTDGGGFNALCSTAFAGPAGTSVILSTTSPLVHISVQ